jgi:predicted GIY-YIG superfamily endonuclease
VIQERWFAYFVRCADGSLYCGMTNDLERRVAAHNAGRGARYTRSRLPVELVWKRRALTRSHTEEAFTDAKAPARGAPGSCDEGSLGPKTRLKFDVGRGT